MKLEEFKEWLDNMVKESWECFSDDLNSPKARYHVGYREACLDALRRIEKLKMEPSSKELSDWIESRLYQKPHFTTPFEEPYFQALEDVLKRLKPGVSDEETAEQRSDFLDWLSEREAVFQKYTDDRYKKGDSDDYWGGFRYGQYDAIGQVIEKYTESNSDKEI